MILTYTGGVKEGFLLEIMRTQKDIKETGKGHFKQRDWYGRKPRGGENIFKNLIYYAQDLAQGNTQCLLNYFI